MKTANDKLIEIVMKMLMLKIVLLLLSPLLLQLGISSTSLITIFLYSLLIINSYYVLAKYSYILKKDLLVISLIAVFFFANYILFPENRPEYTTLEMMLNYILYIPISVLLIPKITDWSTYFEKGEKYTLISIAFILPIFLLSLTSFLNYMEFSYAVLPIATIAAINAGKKMDKKNIIIMCVYLVIMLSFGARGPIVFLALAFLVPFVLNRNVGKKVLVIVPVVLSSVLLLSSSKIQEMIARYAWQSGSYALINILQGAMFKSQSRDALYELCRVYISKQSIFQINGLFGDRAISSQLGWPYSHSIIYEAIISFGWIFGVLFLGLIFFYIVKVYFKSNSVHKLMLVYIFLAFFARFFVSGSFVVEGRFYLFLGILLSLNRITKNKAMESEDYE